MFGAPLLLSLLAHLSHLAAAGRSAAEDGVCDLRPRGGKPTKGPCSPEEFMVAIASKEPGVYDFELPQGGCSFHRQIDVGDGQEVSVRDREDSRSEQPAPVLGRFAVGGSGRLTLDHVHLEGQHLALLVAGEGAVVHANRVEFAHNRHEWAGAVALLGGELHLTDCDFHDNECNNAAYGGTIFVRSGTLEVQRTRFEGNRAARGGAIFVDTGAAEKAPNIVVSDCTFEGNRANEGGAIFIKDGHSLDVGWGVRSSTFRGNEPDDSCVVFDGVHTGTAEPEHRAWTNAEANSKSLPNEPGPEPKPIGIRCDPNSLPREYCPTGIPCPMGGVCPIEQGLIL